MDFLSDDERLHLRAQHKRERDRRVCDRIKAVLLYDKDWSVKDIASWIEGKWGIKYSVSGLISWLGRHGFTYKKPAVVPGKANEDLQRIWLAKYEELKVNLPVNETICFTDGVHPTHNAQPAYGWMKKGKRTAIASTSGRSCLKISGAVDVISHKIVVQQDKTLNAGTTIEFFRKVEAAYPEMSKVRVFCDNASYYRNKLVTNYLKSSKIELHFLPPYSPNLNPIERLWKWMKECVIYHSYYQEFEDFRKAIFGFFSVLAGADPGSVIDQRLRTGVRDRFSPLNSPIN